jgi:hypothetical protein
MEMQGAIGFLSAERGGRKQTRAVAASRRRRLRAPRKKKAATTKNEDMDMRFEIIALGENNGHQ